MKGKQVTEKKKTVEECRSAYIEAKREYERLCARFEELKSAVDESHAVGSAAYGLRPELSRLEHALKAALFEQAIASAPPVPVEAVAQTDREVATKICKDIGAGLGQVMRDYWK